MKKPILEIIVFVSGMGIMVFELVGSRILAPYVGTTIIVWSCLIGVILASLSLGYWWGGRRADKKPDYQNFSKVIFLSAVFIALTGFFKLPILKFLEHINDIRVEAIIASLILFAPGSFFLAAIAPYAVRLKIADLKQSGVTVGKLSAIGTAGSIVGAFITGIILVAYLSNTKIIFLLSILLMIASILSFSQKWIKAKITLILIFLLFIPSANHFDQIFLPPDTILVNSQYLDIMVAKDTLQFSNGSAPRPVLALITGVDSVQSAMFTDQPDSAELIFPYFKFFNLAFYFNPAIKNSLMIGGAGYSWPKYYLKNYPEASIDVIELDPKMTEVAKNYFNLKDSSRLTTYNQDGRVFLNRNQKKYDAVFMDAFKSSIIPFQLTTLETIKKIYDSLNNNGVVVTNLISSITGDNSQFLRAEYMTYKKIFPQVYVYRVNSSDASAEQNLILVALKTDKKIALSDPTKLEFNDSYLSHVWGGEISKDAPTLTDDFAPVDHYMRILSN